MVAPKLVIFDMDGTLTESRLPIKRDMVDALRKLAAKRALVIVSGSTRKQMYKQIRPLFHFKTPLEMLAQSGNDCFSIFRGMVMQMWQEKMSKEEIAHVLKYLKRQDLPLGKKYLQLRGCQISYSFVGHDASLKRKKKFDPEGKVRQHFLEQFPFRSRLVEVHIGGTTCIDFTPKGKNKGYNVKRLAELMSIPARDMLYVGDSLFKGGNDETMIGVCRTKRVKNPRDTLKIIKSLCH